MVRCCVWRKKDEERGDDLKHFSLSLSLSLDCRHPPSSFITFPSFILLLFRLVDRLIGCTLVLIAVLVLRRDELNRHHRVALGRSRLLPALRGRELGLAHPRVQKVLQHSRRCLSPSSSLSSFFSCILV